MRVIAFFALLPLLFACERERQAPPETPVSKKVTYNIFAARDYGGTPVENMTAELRLQMRLINYRTGEQQLIWDSLVPVRRVTDFPFYDNKLVVEKSWPVLNSHQKLNGSYSVIYREGTIISQQGKSDEAVPGMNAISLEVGL